MGCETKEEWGTDRSYSWFFNKDLDRDGSTMNIALTGAFLARRPISATTLTSNKEKEGRSDFKRK